MRDEIQHFIEELKISPDTLGVAVFGSAARGDGRPDSDVDLFVLTTEGERRDVQIRGDVTFEIVYSSEENARAFSFKRTDSYLNMWKDAKIFFDKDGGLARLQAAAETLLAAGKKQLSPEKLKHTQFDFEDSLRAIASLILTDTPTADMFLHRQIFNLLQFYFDKNCLWAPPPKKQLVWLRQNDSDLAKKFDEFYSHIPLEKKFEIATNLVSSVTDPR